MVKAKMEAPKPKASALNLKGGISLKKASKKKKKKRKHDKEKSHSSSSKRARTTTTSSSSSSTTTNTSSSFQKVDGTGRILTSGSTVYGKNTLFFKEIKIGDALFVKHPTSLKDEIRVVKMILSDISISLSSSFSSDLISNQMFCILKQPELRAEDQEAALEALQQAKVAKTADVHAAAYGTYGGTNKVTMRVKSGSAFGGYKIVTINADKKMSRSDMLNMRAGKKGDRMCM